MDHVKSTPWLISLVIAWVQIAAFLAVVVLVLAVVATIIYLWRMRPRKRLDEALKDLVKNTRWLISPVIAAVLIAAFLAALVWKWHAFPSPIKLLVCALGLGLGTAIIYWLMRPRKRLDEALEESNYEKFRRLEGLYGVMRDKVRTENRDAVTVFELQKRVLEASVGYRLQGGVREWLRSYVRELVRVWLERRMGYLPESPVGYLPESRLDKMTLDFTRDDAPDLVHNLHLALLQFATVDYLEFNIESLESDYRQAVGPTAYNAYLAAIALKKRPDPEHAEYESFLRTESTYLASETRRQQLLKQHAEATRQRLLEAAFRSWWRNIIPLVAVLLAFLISLSWVQAVENAQKEQAAPRDSGTVKFARPYLVFDGQPPDFARAHYKALFKAIMIAALLALAGIAGATGGMMSVIQRMHASTPESDPATDLWALSQAETAVFFAPVEGLIFAIVLSLCFAGGVLKGTIFPELTGPRESEWFLTLFNGKNLAIWLLWAFIAGFLERLVPDTLDSLAKQQQANISSKSTPTARNFSSPGGGSSPP